jgi:hypothetical protein
MSYEHYVKVKDKICICYYGHATEYIVQLRLLRPSLEATFPGMFIALACRPQYMHYLSSDPQSTSTDTLHQQSEYGWVFNVMYDANEKIHPIWKIIRDCKTLVQKRPVVQSKSHHGIVCPEGNFPTGSLNAYQTTQIRSWVQGRGFKPLVIGTSTDGTNLPIDKRPSQQERVQLARTAGFVVGVECDMLYEAMDAGIPTALVPTGCQELYEAMCEKPIILGV